MDNLVKKRKIAANFEGKKNHVSFTLLIICMLLIMSEINLKGFPDGSVIKNGPVTQEMWVGSLSQEDPPGKEVATHSSILSWKIPRPEEPGGLQSKEPQRVNMTERRSMHAQE